MNINKILRFSLVAISFIFALSVSQNAAAVEEKTYFAVGKAETKSKTKKKYDQSLSEDMVYRAAFGKAEDIKILLKKSGDPEAKNVAGIPVLMIAVVRKDSEAALIVKELIKGGANVNAMNKNNSVAVLEAVKNGRPDILQILIDNHAVLGIVRDAYGNDLLTIAESRGNLDVVKILNAGLENEKDKIQALKSQDNFINLIQDYAFLSCANEYLNFYISNQTKGVNMVAFNDVITDNTNEMSNVSGQIKMLFKMTDAELQQIQVVARGEIMSQMRYYETNQNRELNRIGTDSDLNSRCRKIAGKWNASKINLEQYRRNTK